MKLPQKIADAVKNTAAKGARSFYLYDTASMCAKIAHLAKIMPKGVEIFYAMKANPHPAFLKAARAAGAAGIEIASLGEATKAVAAGFRPGQLIYTGPGKTPEELRWSVGHGVRTVHIESLAEAHRLDAIGAELGKTQDILLRVNPNFHIHGAAMNFSGDSSKFGVDESLLREFLPQILALKNLRFRGLHVYAASGILNVADLLKNCEFVFRLVKEVEANFKAACPIVDFGGGFGVDYLETGKDFSPEDYAKGLGALIAQFGLENRAYVLELGRYLAADSGWFCTEILDIKTSLGKKQIVCAGGSNQFRRPTALHINYPFEIVRMQKPKLFAGQEKVAKENAFIGGPLCTSADRLTAHDIHVEEADIGDIVVFGLAGAYGYSMSHLDFLSHAHPPEIDVT